MWEVNKCKGGELVLKKLSFFLLLSERVDLLLVKSLIQTLIIFMP